MTPRQIRKALENAGFDMTAVHEVNRDEVEIFVDDGTGHANEKKTNKARIAAVKILGWKGGYYTGYRGFVMQAKPLDLGEYGDKSSRWHY